MQALNSLPNRCGRLQQWNHKSSFDSFELFMRRGAFQGTALRCRAFAPASAPARGRLQVWAQLHLGAYDQWRRG